MPLSRVVDQVTKLAEPVCTELGYELVDVEFVREGNDAILRLVIDKSDGISAEDCATVSRRMDPLLDAANPITGAYYLQVSSPGLDRPLRRQRDFERFVGSQVAIRTFAAVEGMRNIGGVIGGWRDDHVVLEKDGKEILVPFAQIAKARLVPEL